MPGKHNFSRADAGKMASLSIVWGAAAGVAYLGLISHAVALLKTATGWSGPGTTFDSGLLTLHAAPISPSLSALSSFAVAAIPIACAAILGLGVAAWIR